MVFCDIKTSDPNFEGVGLYMLKKRVERANHEEYANYKKHEKPNSNDTL